MHLSSTFIIYHPSSGDLAIVHRAFKNLITSPCASVADQSQVISYSLLTFFNWAINTCTKHIHFYVVTTIKQILFINLNKTWVEIKYRSTRKMTEIICAYKERV